MLLYSKCIYRKQTVILSRYELEDRGIVVRFQAKTLHFIFFKEFRSSVVPLSPRSVDTGGCPPPPPEIKGPRLAADHSLLFSIECKKKWSYTSTPPCVRNVHRENITVTFALLRFIPCTHARENGYYSQNEKKCAA